jgi:hemoglobin
MSQRPVDDAGWRALGGEPGMMALVADFVDRMISDPIIGFRFVGVDRDRLVRRELEHASEILGGPLRYEGRPLAAVHRRLGIHAGQLRRRLAILAAVGRAHGADPAALAAWVEADRALGPFLIDPGDCHG